MKITEKEVNEVAMLARLHFEPEEKKSIQKDLSSILEFMDKLNELNTENVEPLSHIQDLTNVVRKDAVVPFSNLEAIISLAPQREKTFIVVPRVI